MFRSKSWFGGNSFWKPKNLHSLESLKYLYNVLSKNQTVNENNRSLLVETLRSIAEILIWGDQNDSTVFDFFLEKNMLSFFLKIMKQKCGSYVCVQLLQTLNILFENIRNETSLYYLLSNNHVNSIIVHKFDFSDEEVMAYYISFLKTLSLKLNPHTIHFFYNESTNDFPLYTEAIKFFNNGESMVRIAVRTLTLNVYKVEDKNMLNMIRDKTAAPYFSNLVWFIGNHVLELDNCIRDCCSGSHELRPKLADLAAEHLDHLHYINDILHLEIDDLNQVLADHLLHRLFIPLYVSSLDRNYVPKGKNPPPKISSILSLFLLSQVFLILNHKPLVRILARIILNGNESVFSIPENITTTAYSTATAAITNHEENSENSETVSLPEETPEERRQSLNLVVKETLSSADLSLRPFLNSVLDALDSTENDYAVLFGLCLLRSLHENKGINQELLSNYFANDHVANKEVEDESENVQIQHKYNEQLVEKLITIIGDTVKLDSKVRLVTLQLAISLILKVVMDGAQSFLGEKHLKDLEGARGENILLLQNYFKHDELFLEIFEDEYLDMSSMKEVSVEYLLMDSNFLLPPVGSPLTGITFDKRLPCGDLERSRRSIRVYFLLRRFHLTLKNEPEKYLPLINTQNCVMIDDSLDLTNSDLVSCVVITKDNTKTRRFMVIDIFQLILVEPSPKRSGWGIAKFVGFLQDIEVLGDKSDNRVLHITVKSSPTQHFSQGSSQSKAPVLVAKFLFEDYIRCMACKTRLIKGKQKARERKLFMIARLLDIVGTSPSPPQNVRRHARQRIARADRPPTHHYTPLSKTLPGLAIAVVNETDDRRKSREQSPSASSLLRSQEEEIPLGKIRNNNTKIGSQQSSSTSVGHGMTLNLNAPKNNTSSSNQKNNESSINQQQTNEILSPSITTPQSETSFISSFSSPTPNPSSSPSNSSSKKKKGTIETV